MCCASPLPLSVRCVVMEIVLLQRTFLGYPLETRAGGKLQLNEWNSYHQLEKVWCEERIQLHNSVSNQDHTFQQLSNTIKDKGITLALSGGGVAILDVVERVRGAFFRVIFRP